MVLRRKKHISRVSEHAMILLTAGVDCLNIKCHLVSKGLLALKIPDGPTTTTNKDAFIN